MIKYLIKDLAYLLRLIHLTEHKILIATCKHRKCLYCILDNFPFIATGPVYNKNCLNSVAFQCSMSSRDLGKRQNS